MPLINFVRATPHDADVLHERLQSSGVNAQAAY